MLSKTETATLNKKLKDLKDQYKRSYEILQQKSEAKYKTTLKTEQTFNARQGFYYDEDRQEFQKICNELREQAHRIVDAITNGYSEQNTKAPSTEAANVVTLIGARKNISADEIDQLMTRYGHDCPMVYAALLEKAQGLGYRDFKPHPVTEAAENMQALSGIIDKTFNASRAEGNMVSTLAAFDVATDTALPTGE